MIYSISGSRDFTNYEFICEILDSYINISHINVGDCKGVDKLVENYCIEKNISYTVFKADWSLGLKAGPLRNKLLITDTEKLIAFLADNSKGTKSAINIAKSLNIKVDVYKI